VLQLLLNPANKEEKKKRNILYNLEHIIRLYLHAWEKKNKVTLLKRVAESTVIFLPKVQMGCFNASLTLISFIFSIGHSLLRPGMKHK
jgi:hypothetical protein